jgi:hypothetical protein
MYVQKVKVKYWEPKMAEILLETPNHLSSVEAENMALEEFKEQYPEALDYVVEETLELN